jgi:galactokinase
MSEKAAGEVGNRFRERYSRTPEGVARAPGRVNIIGEHTDYNGGWALPAAVDLATFVAYAPRDDDYVVVYSEPAGAEARFDLVDDAGGRVAFWARYAWGVGMALKEAGLGARGLDMYVASGVPLGGGLSSSASFEVALALAYMGREAGEAFDGVRLVHLCRRAENAFVGVNCGVMDQYSSIFGAEGKALLLDCLALESREVDFPSSAALVIADTTVRHALGEETEGYHKRQDECREAANVLGVETLREVTDDSLDAARGELGDVLYRRVRHIVTENARVLETADALPAGDLARTGELLRESHESLRDDYEVSCRELDLMVEAAEGCDGHFGGRMVGGGFGGCTVSLVLAERAEGFARELAARYKKASGLDAGIHVVRPGRGAGFVGSV